MPDPTVNTVFTARDQVSATVKKIRTELTGFQKSVGGVKGAVPIFDKLANATGGLVNPVTLAVGGVVALGGALISSVKAAAQEEVGIARLNAALAANVKGFDGSTAAVEKTIRQRELLAFSDDKLRESLSLLVPATKDVDEALRLQAIAMDLARLRGTDLAETSVLISKVYQGNLTSLKRFGINLKGVSTATEALAKIQELAAGQAQAYGDTLQGTTEAIDIKLQDLSETIGSNATPAVKALADGLLFLTGGLDEASSSATKVQPTMEGFNKQLAKTNILFPLSFTAISEWTDAVKKANDAAAAMPPLADILGDTADATDDVRRSFEKAYDPTQAMADALDKVADNAESAAERLAEAIYGPDILRGELSELQEEAGETEREIRKLARKKDLTKEDREELKQLRGDLAKTNSDILVTATKLKAMGEPLPKGLQNSIDRIIDRQDTSNARISNGLRLYRLWLNLTGGKDRSAPMGQRERRQHGGPVVGGREYDVGEAGPERLVMFPGGGGFVLPGRRGGGSIGAGGEVTVPIVLKLDGDVVYRAVERRQVRRLRDTPFV